MKPVVLSVPGICCCITNYPPNLATYNNDNHLFGSQMCRLVRAWLSQFTSLQEPSAAATQLGLDPVSKMAPLSVCHIWADHWPGAQIRLWLRDLDSPSCGPFCGIGCASSQHGRYFLRINVPRRRKWELPISEG